MNRAINCGYGMAGAAALCVMAAASPVLGVTSYFDGIFQNSDWTLTVLTNANGVGSTSVGFQVPVGGNPNEYRRVRDILVASGPNAAVTGFHMNVNALYNPGTQGAITSIAYSEDSINFLPPTVVPGNGQGTGLAILQGGKYFRLNNPALVMPYSGFSSWAPNAAGAISASDMWEYTPAGVLLPGSNPDFSASGGVMQLGFWRGNSGNGSYETDCGIDNWHVDIIPVPGSAALLALGGIAAGRRRR
ncbi:MAG: hypothetical protein ACOYN0_06515 [Phycisphaerales bacterium]